MAVPVIKGVYARLAVRELGIALTSSVAVGTLWWTMYKRKQLAAVENFYKKNH